MNQRQLLRSAALSLALALGACGGGTPDERAYDLAADLPLAEIRKEVGGIDFGTAAARVHLAGGWYANERGEWEGPTFIWSRGPVSVVEFDVLAPRDLRAEVRCLPLHLPGRPQQVVAVELNGRRITELALTPGFREYAFTLPGDGLATGRNRLAFRYGWIAPPGRANGRRVAVAWDFLRFRPAPQASAEEPRVEGKGEERSLFVPFGVEVDYFLELAETGSFRHRGLAARGRSGGRLVLGVQQEGEEERTLELGEEDGAVEVPLPGAGRRLLRLALRAVPVDPSAGGGGLLLEAPTVHGRPAPPAAPAAPPAAGKPAVVLVVLDGLRPDRLGCYGAKSGLTPNLDAMAREALLFEDAQAQSSWTRPAMASLLTGFGPLEHGVHTARRFLPDGATTLAERLQAAGYRTAGFSPTADVGPGSGLDQGFETFVAVEEEQAAVVLDRALLWLGSYGRQGPFFLYVHAAGAPEPYRSALARAAAAIGRGRMERAAAAAALVPLYDAEVAARDRDLGRVIETLRQVGVYDEALVVVVSDHGEALGEHGHLGHSVNLHGEVLGIPLLVKLPGGKTGARVKLPAQQVDVAPTVLARLGLPAPPELRGLDLAALATADGVKGGAAAGELARRARFSHLSIHHQEVVGVVQDGWKRIEPLGRRFGAESRLYQVARDRGETRDLLGRAPVRAGYLNALIRGEVLRSRARPKRDPAQVDPKVLEALGL